MSNKKVIDKLKNDPLMPLRHSAEHVLHKSAEVLFPGVKKVMGPPIENGFYFDFDYDGKISDADLPNIEAKMQEIIDQNLPLSIRDSSFEELRKIFSDNPFKLEFIDEIEKSGKNPTVCEMGSPGDTYYDIDLCAGPHTSSTGDIKAFKLLSIAGAYWRGDEKNKMLSRIYGTAFDSPKALSEHLEILEARRENDHRKINKFLDIFATSELVGKGLVMYTPNGTIVRNELRDHLLSICKKQGAVEVNIPHMAKMKLYELSGHADKFKDELFKVIGHYNNEYVLKPVNCPHHTQIYASKPRSYRDLPISYVESTQQHRDEKPGSMVGLNRAVSFEIDDGHTFCTPDQTKAEAIKLLKIVKEFYKVFDMWGDHWVSLSFRDPNHPEKFIGEDSDWEKAQSILQEINDELELGGKVMLGEAALYGPKIDIMIKDALGNDRQLGTVQVDFAMPQRFELKYIDSDGQEKTPVMLHRAILGSYHRFIAYLMESTGGAFPTWLAPVQVEIIPISEKSVDYAKQVLAEINKNNLRGQINTKDETMQAKIRDAQLRKVPYMIIIGEKEQESSTVSLRLRTNENLGALPLVDVIEKIKNIYLTKSLKLW